MSEITINIAVYCILCSSSTFSRVFHYFTGNIHSTIMAAFDTVSMISVTKTNKNPQLKPKAETTSSLWYYSPHDMHVSTDDHSIRKHSTFCKPCQCISDWAAHTSPRRWPATGGWFPRNSYKLCGLWVVGCGGSWGRGDNSDIPHRDSPRPSTGWLRHLLMKVATTIRSRAPVRRASLQQLQYRAYLLLGLLTTFAS